MLQNFHSSFVFNMFWENALEISFTVALCLNMFKGGLLFLLNDAIECCCLVSCLSVWIVKVVQDSKFNM